MVIYLGNLATTTTEAQVRDVFGRHCQVQGIRLMQDPVSHRGLGFGFVEVSDEEQALKAIRHLHHTRIGGRAVIVCIAPQRPERRGVTGTALLG